MCKADIFHHIVQKSVKCSWRGHQTLTTNPSSLLNSNIPDILVVSYSCHFSNDPGEKRFLSFPKQMFPPPPKISRQVPD